MVSTVGFQFRIFISPKAIIGEKAVIEEDCKIWHFCNVLNGAFIGKGTSLGMGCFVGNNVRIGENCRLQSYVVMGDGTVIEDDVFISTFTCFTNIRYPRAEVDRRGEYEKILVKHGATIGTNCTIISPVTIGEYAVVGSGAVVTHDVMPHSIVYGNPARHQGWACQCGERLKFEGQDTHCQRCNRVYKINDDDCGIRLIEQ